MSNAIVKRILLALVLGVLIGVIGLHIAQRNWSLISPYCAFGFVVGAAVPLLLSEPERAS